MALNNITRTNTIDEWRIQTNLAANSLNQIETGNYNKTSGTFTISSTGALSITSPGTSLSVVNGALFQSNIAVGKDIVLGSETAQTGNLSVGNTVYIYGGATALYVANNVIANGSLLVKNTITTNNITVNSNVVVVGTANAGYLGVANSGYVGTTLTVVGNTAVGNLTTANSVVADNGRFSNNVTVEHIIAANSIVSQGGARITSNTTTGNLISTSVVADTARFTTNVTFGSSANTYANGNSFVANGGSVVANTARFSQNTSIGQELTTITINATNSRTSGNANAAHFTANNGGSVVADTARFNANTSIGEELTTITVNATNVRVGANANAVHFTASQSVVADNARFATNVAFGSSLQSYANGTSFVANGGSVVVNNARINANTSVGGHIVVTSSVVSDTARFATNVAFGSSLQSYANGTSFVANGGSVVADNARFNANTSVGGHIVTTNSVVADTARFTTNVAFGSSLQSYANGTSFVANGGSVVVNNARINANTSVGGHIVVTSSVVSDTARFATNVAFGSSLQSYANGTSFVSPGGSVVVDSLRVTSETASANISGNVIAGNVNTQGMVHAGSLVSGKTDVGALKATSFETIGSGDALITGKLTVNGDFVLSGDIVYDTDALSISTVTPVISTGAGYFGVFRGNDKGGVGGGTGGSSANANAYIRWSGSANNWQIRDVFNSDATSTYSKILTANLITTSTASVSNNDFASSWLMKNYVDNANTNLKSYVDTSAIQTAAANAGALGISVTSAYQANVGAGLITVTNNYQANVGQLRLDTGNANTSLAANIGAGRIADSAAAQANVGAGLIAYQTTSQANVGAGLITQSTTLTSAYQANVGVEVAARSANVGAGRIADTANSGLGNIIVMGRANGAFGVANLASNTFNGTSGAAAPSNGIISFTSTNGITLVGTSNTITVNTPQDVRTTASPTFNGLTLTNALPLAQGGTGATSATGALTNLLPVGGTSGYVLTTGGTGSYYWAAGGSGGGGSATPGTTIVSTKTTPTVNASQRIFATPIYQTGTGQLRVFINGVRQFASEYTEGANNLTGVASVSSNGYFSTTSASSTLIQDAALAITGTLTGTATITNYVSGKIYYIKTINSNFFSLSETVGGAAITTTAGTTTGLSFTTGHNVTLTTGTSSGDAILLEVDAYTVNPYYANNIAYGPVTGEISASSNTIQLAIDSLESRKITTTAAQANVGAGIITVTSGYQANVGAARIADVATLQANTGAVNIGLSNEITNRQANVGAAVISITNNYQANVGAGRLADVASGQANVGSGLITTKAAYEANVGVEVAARSANVGAGLITVTSAYQANAGAGLITTKGAYEANVGSGLISAKTTSEANVGAARLSAISTASNADNLSSGTVAAGRLGTTGTPQFGSLGVGTAASGTTGEIRATGDITAGYSDDKLKTRLGNIENALDKVSAISGFFYEPNKTAQDLGYEVKREVGVSAQEVQAIMPEVVVPAPVDNQYLTVHYDKLVPLLIEAIKELRAQVEEIKGQIK